jgi:cell division transport system ATP-binding protein
MITAQSVSKKFGDVQALSEISFSVNPGEFVFLTGPSGSGKTTLFRILMHELKPESGSVIIDGQDIFKLKSAQIPLYRRQIGMVFQDFRLLLDRNIFENVALPLFIKHATKVEIAQRVQDCLNIVGLSDKGSFFPSQLSGGELQRVCLARAIVGKPKLILADEPTGNLDPKTSKTIVTLIKKIQEEFKSTIIMATHNSEIVNHFKQRVLRLENGKLVADQAEGKYHD